MITEHYLINKLANIKTISALCSGSPELFGGCSLAQKSSAAALLLLSESPSRSEVNFGSLGVKVQIMS